MAATGSRAGTSITESLAYDIPRSKTARGINGFSRTGTAGMHWLHRSKGPQAGTDLDKSCSMSPLEDENRRDDRKVVRRSSFTGLPGLPSPLMTKSVAIG